MPRVSVLLAFHRVTPFLRPAVRSILGQTFRDFELLLVDDGTGEGLAALGPEADDRRIHLVSLPQQGGIGRAHNTAVGLARGEFLAFMDYDDIALPDRLERQVAALDAEPGLGLIGSHAHRIDETGMVRGSMFTLASARDHRVFSAYTMPLTAPTLMGRLEVLRRFPFRPEFPFSGDYDQLARVVECTEVRALPEVLLHYREYDRQTTAERGDRIVLAACLIRLLTARRRAGREEDLPGASRQLAAALRPEPAAADTYAHFAEWCLAEDFPLLAAYHARRLLSVRRDPRTIARAADVFCRAFGRGPCRTGLLRMFFTGPLRTHGLKPL